MRALQELAAEHGGYVGVGPGQFVFEDGFAVWSYENDRHFAAGMPASEHERLSNRVKFLETRLDEARNRHEIMCREFAHRAREPRYKPLPDDWREQLGKGQHGLKKLKDELHRAREHRDGANPAREARRAAEAERERRRAQAEPLLAEIASYREP